MLNDASAGTIAFKHDSKSTGCVLSSGDTALESVALVCGIGLCRSLEVASTSGCWCVSQACLGLVLLVLLLVFSLVVVVCCALLSLAAVFSLFAVFSVRSVFSARSVFSPGCVFSALSGFLVLFNLVLAVSFSRCGFALGFWFLTSIFVRLSQSRLLARLSCLAFLHTRRPWSISATFSVSLVSLAFSLDSVSTPNSSIT